MEERDREGRVDLRRLRRGIEKWRRHKTSKGMPALLWRQAVSGAQVYGVQRIAQDFRLNYESLRKKVNAAGEKKEPVSKHGFIELKPLSVVNRSDASSERTEIQMRLRTWTGGCIEMRVPNFQAMDWDRMFSAWMRAESELGLAKGSGQ